MAPKLTKEERKALLAAKKAEKKRLAEEKKKQIKVDELERELKYGRLTLKRHEKSWRNLLLSIGLPEVKKQLEYAWHHFERAVDDKDFQISLLMDEIKEAEEQYMMNQRSHFENVGKLIELFRVQLNELNTDNKNAIKDMRSFNEQEVEKLMTTHKDNITFLKMMLYGLEMKQKEQDQFIRCEYCARIEEEMGKNTDILQKLSFDVHEKYAEVWNNTMDFLDAFYKRTNERRKQYEQMYNQEEQVNALLQSQLERMNTLSEAIRKLKYKYVKLQKDQGQKVIDLGLERHYFADSFWSLKMQLEQELESDNGKLTLLTVETNEAMDVLNQIETKGKYILQLASICREYETLREKVLPFPILGKSIKYASIEDKYYQDVLELKTFWKRVGQADAIRYSMYEEKEYLTRENDKIRKLVHEYCECLNCVAYPQPPPRTRLKILMIDDDGHQTRDKSDEEPKST